MNRYYSQTSGTCYLEGIHDQIPTDAVLIDDGRYDEVIANPDPAKMRSHDADGLPVLIDAPVYVPTVVELEAAERIWRDSQVTTTEWLVTRHRDEQDMQQSTTLTAEQFAALLVYRQMLRDWPQDSRFPYCAFRPVEPSWLAEQVQ
ncbi:hypothetical protein D3C77_177530 [compost metagenome]